MSSAVKRVTAVVASWTRAAASAQKASFSAAAAAPSEALKKAEKAAEARPRAAEGEAAKPRTLADLTDNQLLHLLSSGAISPHKLEADIGDATRAVHVRRLFTAQQLAVSASASKEKAAHDPFKAMAGLPMAAFDHNTFYKSILNTNCEAVIGYVPLPVGVVGPLLLDGKEFRVPMATTEGALLASTNRGCTAIRKAGGATTVLTGDGMTRAPLVRMPTLREAAELKAWVESPANFEKIAAAFSSTTRFGRVKEIKAVTGGRNVYIRFKCFTGDAMGMNMITKGVNEALKLCRSHFPSMRVMSLSGNFCTDKKPSAVNWIDGRGKSVSAEVRLSGHVLKTVLKTNAEAMVELNTAKNLVGSALAGSIGGFNAHASNIVTAVFLATGQDGAQNVESSTCMTLLEVDHSIRDPADPDAKAGPGVVMTVTMPSIEVGTIGGGTTLPAQAACLDLLGLKGSSASRPGANSEQLARVVAGSVLAGELSLLSALTTNDLLNSHMKLNRKPSSTTHGDGGAALITPSIMARLGEMDGRAAAAAASRATLFTETKTATATATATTPTSYKADGAATAAAPRDAIPGLSAAPASSATVSAAAASGPAATPVVANAVPYTTTYHAAHAPGTATSRTSAAAAAPAHHTAPIGTVPGGAPAGSHPYPLHLGAAAPSVTTSASAPGRRYFAAPTSHLHRLGSPAAPTWAPGAGRSAFKPATAGGDASEAAFSTWDEDRSSEPRLPVP